MRSAEEIRSAILRLRDVKRLPYTYMTECSRCSREQIISAFRLEATEDVLRRLDAYLDATHLHNLRKDTKLLREIEDLDRELYREYKAKSLHPLTIQKMSADQQKRLLNAMHYRAKNLLRDKIEKDTGVRLLFSDGLDYWQTKKKAAERGAAVVAPNRKSHRFSRPRPVGQG